MTVDHFLEKFFNPNVVAIIGARQTPGFGFQLPLSLKKFGHGEKIRLVNPRGGTLHGLPLYKSLKEIPDKVDLAIVITPAAAVPQVLIDIADAGITNVILESAGFSETDDAGKALQEKCRSIALERGLKVMGPNCVGVLNAENKFTTGEVIESVMALGNIGLVAQSGVFGSILLDHFPSRGLKVSRGVTLGNRLIVDECDVLDYFCRDEKTEVVLMYLEGAADGKKLRASLEKITKIKPVIILKSGTTEAGASATSSHTGSMAGNNEIYGALFAQTGAIRAQGVADLIDLATVFSSQPLPAGNKICVITSSGSLGALAIDGAVDGGYVPAKLSQATIDKIKVAAPAWMNVKNPLDVGPSGIYKNAFEAVMLDPGVDAVIIIPVIPYSVIEAFGPIGLTAEMWLGNLDAIRKVAPDKPVVAAVTGHENWVRDVRKLGGGSIAVLEYPEKAARAASMLLQYSRFKKARSAKK